MSSSNRIFDKYEIQHRIAIGGMGEVFYAMQRGVSGFERPVILKSLLPDLAQQQDLVNQFLDEARVAATLNHPNVVSIFEVGLWNGTFYIAMEYIRGRNLAQLMRRAAEHQRRLPPQIAARIIRDAALGLDHAHTATDSAGRRLNIVHRDISPQNIMLREDGVTKVVDFGIASAANRSTRTATGTLKGKLAYMAPEQIQSAPTTPLVDEFALGIVFWELLVGRRLFKADNDLDLIKQVLAAEVPRPDTLALDVPGPLADVAIRMMARDPLARYGSLAEVAEALEGQLEMTTPGVSPAAFMRRLGTEDLKVKQVPAATGDNYVISLNGAPIEEPVDMSTSTGMSPPVAPPKSRAGLALGGALFVALAFTLGIIAFKDSAPAPVAGVVGSQPAPSAPVRVPTPLPRPQAPPKDGHLEIVTSPPGAQLRLDGKPLGRSPQTVDVSPQTTHYVLVELPGFERLETEVSLNADEKRTLRLVLKGRKVAITSRLPPSAAAQPGFLTISTTPWTKVSVDGEPIGSTPINKKRLTPGSHRLLMVNEGANINATRSVTISSGENTKLQLKLP